MIALFDEYQSKENAKHISCWSRSDKHRDWVTRALKENARQGFWNGSTPPVGYKTVEVEKRGARIKKKLDIDAVEAEMVRLVFRLFLEGDGAGSMGVKAIVVWLNTRGYCRGACLAATNKCYRTRGGATWGVGPIHRMLGNPAYTGKHHFNRVDRRTKRKKDEAEHVIIDVPAIITPDAFDQVQKLPPRRLQAAANGQPHERDPRVTPPRVVTGPILLTGLAFCASCGGAMTSSLLAHRFYRTPAAPPFGSMRRRTGTSKTGKVHRYYTCSTCNRHGKTACTGRSIQMDRLDDLVTETIATRLMQPDRIAGLLSALLQQRAEEASTVDERIGRLEHEAREVEERLSRLYRAIEDGVAELDDMLKDRIASLKAEREKTRGHFLLAAVSKHRGALERTRSASRPKFQISRALIERFAVTIREKMCSGEVPFRKAYLGAILDRIEVDGGKVRIIGRKDVLEQAVARDGTSTPGVRSFVRNWRSGRASQYRVNCLYIRSNYYGLPMIYPQIYPHLTPPSSRLKLERVSSSITACFVACMFTACNPAINI